MHHILILLGVLCLFITLPSKGDNNIIGHFSFTYVSINLTFGMCNRPQAGAPNENIVQNHLNIALLNVF